MSSQFCCWLVLFLSLEIHHGIRGKKIRPLTFMQSRVSLSSYVRMLSCFSCGASCGIPPARFSTLHCGASFKYCERQKENNMFIWHMPLPSAYYGQKQTVCEICKTAYQLDVLLFDDSTGHERKTNLLTVLRALLSSASGSTTFCSTCCGFLSVWGGIVMNNY